MVAAQCRQRPHPHTLVGRKLSIHALRTPVALGAALVLTLAVGTAGWLVGRYRADAQGAATVAAQARIEALQRALQESQARESVLVSERSGLVAERAEAARLLAQTQAQLAREAQDAAFFRAVASAGADSPVSIQRLRIRSLAGRRFRVTLVLARPLGREDQVGGSGTLALEGRRGGQGATLQMAQVSVDKTAKLTFSYRTIQTIELDMELPEGFEADRLIVELAPARVGAAGLRQAFLWQISPV